MSLINCVRSYSNTPRNKRKKSSSSSSSSPDDEASSPPIELPTISSISSSLSTITTTFTTTIKNYQATSTLPIPLFESIPCEAYGPGTGSSPLSTAAQVLASTSDPTVVEIACYDPSTVKAVAAAVMESRDVLALVGSVNPQVDEGTGIVMVKVPKMGRERREGIAALVKDAGESATQKCRGVRRDGMEGVKKAVKGGGGVGKDEGKRREKEIDAKCKEAVKDIDDIVKQRVQEILG